MKRPEREPPSPPLVLAEGAECLDGVVERLRQKGWSVREGFLLHEREWNVRGVRLVCTGVISDPDDAAAALLAVARGAGLVVSVRTDVATYERLYEDLSRVGEVAVRRTSEWPDNGLSPKQEELLMLLAEGASLKDAAAALNYSHRTIERRLAGARVALGANTTAEALLRFRQRSSDAEAPEPT